MSLSYRPLFNIQFFHEFYKNNNGEYSHLDKDIQIVPTAHCQKEMTNQGLLFRTTPGGYTVLYRAYKEDNVEKPLIPLTEPRKFSFQIFSKNPYIIHYSSLPLEGKRPGIFYLTNLEDNIQDSNGTNELLLIKDKSDPYLSSLDEINLRPSQFTYEFKKAGNSATVSLEDRQSNIVYTESLVKLDDGTTTLDKNFRINLDLRPQKTGLFTLKIDDVKKETFYLDNSLLAKNPFGLIDIFYHADVPTDYQFADTLGNVSSKTYTLRLNHRKTIWKYLVGLKYRDDIDPADLEIVSDIFPATFTQQTSYKLADNTTVIPFDSGTTTIPLTKEPIKGIKLKRTITGHGSGSANGNSSTEETPLPNPEIANIKTANGKIYSEVYIYV